MVAKDREGAQWGSGHVLANHARGVRQISRRLRNVVPTQEQQIWLLGHHQLHGSIQISSGNRWPNVRIGYERDADLLAPGEWITDPQMPELDILQRAMPRTPGDNAAADEACGHTGGQAARTSPGHA